MMTHIPHRKNAAFTMIEMLIVIVLIGAFVVIAARLTVSALGVISQTKQQADALRIFDRAMDQLQTDIWNADDFTLPKPNTLLIDLPDEHSVLWLIKDNTLQRAHSIDTQVQGSKSFNLDEVHLNFQIQNGQLAIEQPLQNGQPLRTTWMSNQKRILWSL